MNTTRVWVFTFLQMIGISAFFGSILAMIVLGRTHDFGSNWNEIVTSRSDILRILLLVNLPGLFLYVFIDLFQQWKWMLKSKVMTLKLLLNLGVLLLTTLVILPSSIHMVQAAKEANMPIFLSLHSKEDIWGPVNMLMFLSSVGIGVKHKVKISRGEI